MSITEAPLSADADLAPALARPRDGTPLGLLRRAFLLWLLLASVVAALVGGLVWQHDADVRSQALHALQARLQHTAYTLHRRLTERAANVHALLSVPAVREFLASPADPARRRNVDLVFSGVVESYGVIDHLRLIGRDGHEMLRVNFDGTASRVVPVSALQHQAGSDCVQAGLQLAAGELFVSRVALNVERGRIEHPDKPVLCLVAALPDAQGEPGALLAVSVLADPLWRTEDAPQTFLLGVEPQWVDHSGRWLAHADATRRWGDQRGRADGSLAQVDPEVWAVVSTTRSGAVKRAGSTLLYDTVALLDTSATPGPVATPSWKRVVTADAFWKVLVEVPDRAVDPLTVAGQPAFWALAWLGLVTLTVPAWLWAGWLAQRRALRRQQQRAREVLDDLYEQAPCGYHSLDGDGRIVRMNATELGWLGYRADEVLGRPMRDLLSPSSRGTMAEAFPGFLETGHIADLELELLRKDGSLLPVSLSATAVRDTEGRFLHSRSTVFDISERQRLQAQLRELAYADALTGLPNRRRFMDAAALEVTRARRQGTPLSLLLLDVDHFKRINDELGHPTGDAVLQALGQLLQRLNRANDVAGRIGGEEFAVLLPGADGSAAAAVAERLRQAVSALQVLPPAAAVPQTPVRLTVSLGVATWRPTETLTAVGGLAEGEAAMEVGRLLKLADQALYAAKAGGRNRVEVGADLV